MPLLLFTIWTNTIQIFINHLCKLPITAFSTHGFYEIFLLWTFSRKRDRIKMYRLYSYKVHGCNVCKTLHPFFKLNKDCFQGSLTVCPVLVLSWIHDTIHFFECQHFFEVFYFFVFCVVFVWYVLIILLYFYVVNTFFKFFRYFQKKYFILFYRTNVRLFYAHIFQFLKYKHMFDSR